MAGICRCWKKSWRRQSLIVLLEQHGKKRSQILVSLAYRQIKTACVCCRHSSVGDRLLAQSKELNQLLTQCQEANLLNGQSIQLQQATTANQLRILHAANLRPCITPKALPRLVKPSTRSQA